LPPDHGFPARTIVPGWVGTYSIKWLGRITVSSEHMWVVRNTRRYVMMGDAWSKDDYAPARGAPITRHPIRSSLALPWPAKLERGRQRIRGYARGAEEPIVRVEWSADRGATWQDAELVSPSARYAWVEFAFTWDATPGEHALMTRATDTAGDTQPMSQPFNDGGYMFSMVHPHPVTVSA
jgi:DMSO/TMAO reductase YedYZ molybdopterin-dependent catalytic subunit